LVMMLRHKSTEIDAHAMACATNCNAAACTIRIC
jgi:hypothetical protein